MDPTVAADRDACMLNESGSSSSATVGPRTTTTTGCDDHHKILRQLPPLLKALFRDCCDPTSTARGRTSVQSCLRTKTRPPCDQVKSVLAEFRDASPTERSLYTTSVASLLVSLKKEATSQGSSSSPETPPRPSLYYVSYLFVPIHYLHLLLQVSIEADEEGGEALRDTGTATAARSRSSSDAHSNNKMIKHVIRCLAGFVCSILEDERANDGPVSTCNDDHVNSDAYLCESAASTYRAAHLASFVVESMVRINNQQLRRSARSLTQLWRSICEIMDAGSASGGTVPVGSPTIVHHAARALLDHIQDGTDIFQRIMEPKRDHHGRDECRIAKTPTDSDLSLHCKIVDFLLDRLRSFLSHLVTHRTIANDTSAPDAARAFGTSGHTNWGDSADDLTAAFRTLTRLRGLLSLLSQQVGPNGQNPWSEPLANAFAALSTKLDELVSSHLCPNHGSGIFIFDVKALESYFAVLSSDPGKDTALFVGQASTLIHVLELATEVAGHPVASADRRTDRSSVSTTECTLRIVHALIFDVLPGATAFASCRTTSSTVITALVMKLLTAASSCLLMFETASPCHGQGDHHTGKFHQWLLGWLAQLPTSLPSSSPDCHPLSHELALCLLQLHVSGLRRAGFSSNHRAFLKLAVLALFDFRTETRFRRRLGRFLIRLLGDGSETARLVTALASSCLRSLWRSLGSSARSGTKRKRSTSGAGLSPMDLEIVLNVAANLQLDTPEITDIEAGWHHGNSCTNGSVSASGLQAAAIRATIPTSAARRSKLPMTLPNDCLASFSAAWEQTARSDATPTVKKSLLVLGVQICNWMHARCSELQGVEIESAKMEEMCETLRQILRLHSGSNQACDAEEAAAILTAIQALGTLAPCISPNFPKESLIGITSSFRELLSSLDWPLRSSCLGSMVRFAQTLRNDHSGVLRHCVPDTCRIRLGSRLKKELLVPHHDLTNAWGACATLLARQRRSFRPTTRSTRTLFSDPASRSTALISAGSFFMTMPTQDGRHAIVIFPPCPDSLKDIYYMLGIDEEGAGDPLSQRPAVRKIHGFEPTLNGSCTVMLDDGTSS